MLMPDKTDISLILSLTGTLAVFFGAITALVIAAFVAGFLMGHRSFDRSRDL
jgi:hypothetical protein